MRKKLLGILLVVCLAVAQQAHSQACYNPSSNTFIPPEGAFTTSVTADSDSTGTDVSYVLGTISVTTDDLFPTASQLNIPGFGRSYTPGMPWLPLKADTYYLDSDCTNIRVEVLSADSVEYPMEVAPVRPMLLEQDTTVYTTSDIAPVSPVGFASRDSVAKILRVGRRGGRPVVTVLVCPVQYDSGLKRLRVYKEFTYRLSYDRLPSDLDDSDGILAGTRPVVSGNRIRLSYLVVGPTAYREAARDFIAWKRQSGYDVVGLFSDWPSASAVKAAIDSVYVTGGNLEYVLLLGDHEAVPTEDRTMTFSPRQSISYNSDYGYSCVDSDHISDLYIGRIPGKTVADVEASLAKILAVEKAPPTSQAFYQKCLLNAYYQLGDCGINRTIRRFVETCEDIRDYLLQFGITGTRNYYAPYGANPKYWATPDYHGSGLEIPQELQKPAFAWDGNSNVVNTTIASGCNLVFTRTHGSNTSWGYPYYTVNHVASIPALTKSCYPVVYSLSCLTGFFTGNNQSGLCQAMVIKPNSGCVAAVGATQVSYTALNDACAHGIVSHLWPDPGLFKPLGNSSVPSLGLATKYGPTLGETMEGGYLRMEELTPYSELHNQYQREIYHVFGDPSMWINTDVPVKADVSAGVYYGASSSSSKPVFKLTIGDGTDCMIAIVDSDDRTFTFYDSEISIETPSFPLDITVTGHNKLPVTLTYQATSITDPLPSTKGYMIDRVVVDGSMIAYVYTTKAQGIKLTPTDSYGLVVYSTTGFPVYSAPINIEDTVHAVPIVKYYTPSLGDTFVVALTFRGKVIDTKTFILKT